MIERRTLDGGMNNDDSPDFVPKGDYLVAHNCRVQRDKNGMGGSLKPLPSTVPRTVDSLVGTKNTIGAIEDQPNQRIFYFKWHSGNDHRIWCWNRRTNTNLVVLKQADVTGGLGFGQYSYITGVALIGNYLYWCDGVTNEPRRIDVERALRLNNPTYTSPDGTIPDPYVAPLEQWDISVARRVPRCPLKWEKLVSADEADVPDQPTGYLDRNGVQFAFRYVYQSNEISTLGGYSTIAPHNADTRSNQYVSGYDTIKVVMDKDEVIDDEVIRVEFLVRRDNVGSWNVIETIDREGNPTAFSDHNTVGEPAMSFYFYNNELGVPLDDSEGYLPFHDVPLFSNALEIASNRLFLSNNLKGYDYVVGEPLNLSLKNYEWPSGTTWRLFADYYLIEWSCGTGLAEKVVLRVGEWFGPAAGWYDTPFTSVQFNSNSLPLSISINPVDKFPIVDNDNVPTELIEFLNPGCATYTFSEYAGNPAVFTSNTLGAVSQNVKTFRKGKKYKVGIKFFDYAGRNAGVHHSIAEIDIPEPKMFEFDYTIGIDWEIPIGMPIPLWAHSYAIVRNRITESFVANRPNFLRYATKEEDGTYTFESGSPATPNLTYAADWDAIGINIAGLLQYRGIGYVFSDGDLIKLIDSSDNIFYLKVIGVYLDYIMTENYDIGTIGSGTHDYMEIITPKNEPDEYWEVGKHYLITDPALPTRDFSVREGTMTGETFLVRWDDRPQASLIPAMNSNNKYWFIWPQDYGRPTQLLFSKQRRYDTEIAWSSTYFPGTETNQLNQFLSADIRTLDAAIGAIKIIRLTSRTQDYGTVMLAIGNSEVASIYLGRTEFYNAAETPSLINTVDVIGTVNVLRGGFGTLNPESFIENDGDAYWFSAIKSAFVRYAKDGVNAISDRKMATFAAWLGNLVTTSASDVPGVAGIKVAGGFDDFNKEALWSIPPIGSWPIAYTVLDAVVQELAVTETTPGNMNASIVPGEIHRFSMTFNGPVTVNITVWDYFFGQRTFTTVSAAPTFTFVGRPGAPGNITVTTTPSINTLVYTKKLERLRSYPYSAIDRMPKTIAFNENNGRWSHTSSHTPEWFSKIGDQLITFREGILYTHDSTTIGSFYGVQYPAWVSLAFNEVPNSVKRLQGVSVESNSEPSYIHFRTEEPYVQSSDLTAADIRVEEGIYSASCLRDRLSPNTSGTVIDKLYRGDELRGRYAKVLLEWPKLTNFATRIINLISRPSNGHKT